MKLKHPFWVESNPPFSDFSKEIVEPGTNSTFPDGAVGIRVDDDFWIVAALPYDYRDVPLEHIVAEFFEAAS